MKEPFDELVDLLREEAERIPESMRQDTVVRQNLINVLFNVVASMDLVPVASWRPPRSTRDRIDLVGVDASGETPKVQVAFAVDPLVELPKIKSLQWVEAPHKIVISFSKREDKVKQSTFFLTPELTHLYIYG